MSRSVIRIGVAGVIVLTAAGALPVFKAQALPRYAARYEQNCALCHLNPTGGGLRTRYVTEELAPRELAWSPKSPPVLEAIDTRLSKHVTVGADFRELYVTSNEPSRQIDFFQMQGDLYLAFQLDSTSALYYDRGLSNTYELFGLHYAAPWLYVKAGRFVPSYGWKFDDHTHSVREDLGFGPPANSDVGIEVGVARGPVDLQLSLGNGSFGSTQDNDTRLASSGNFLYRLRGGPVAIGAGGSIMHRPGPAEVLDLVGARGSLVLHPLTWIGEVDRVRLERPSSPVEVGLSTSHEVSWVVRQGLEVLATYDFFDPDTDLQSGARSRYGAGVFMMPRSFFSIEALYRTTQADPGPAMTTEDFDEAVAQLHVFF